jgi:hypothetical protein
MNAAKHSHHDNGGAAGTWNVLSIRPPLRCAMALAVMPFQSERGCQSAIHGEQTAAFQDNAL